MGGQGEREWWRRWPRSERPFLQTPHHPWCWRTWLRSHSRRPWIKSSRSPKSGRSLELFHLFWIVRQPPLVGARLHAETALHTSGAAPILGTLPEVVEHVQPALVVETTAQHLLWTRRSSCRSWKPRRKSSISLTVSRLRAPPVVAERVQPASVAAPAGAVEHEMVRGTVLDRAVDAFVKSQSRPTSG